MSKTFKNVLYVTAGVLFAQVVGSFRSFFLARLLEPSDYGIWTGVQVIAVLAPIACLGTVEALLKQVPYYRGKNDSASLRKVENSVFGTIVLAAGFLAFLLLAGARFLPFKFIQDNLLVTQITAASAAISFFTSYYYYRCTAYEDFKLVGIFDSFSSFSSFVCVLLFAWRWGLLGGVIGALLSELLNWLVVARVGGKAYGNVRACFQPSLMGNAVRVGFPITIIWWVYAIHMSVGRMTAISYLGNTATGYYGVGSSIAMLFALVPNMIGRVFYPRVNAQIGAKAGLHALRHSVVTPTSAISLLLPLAQAVIFFLLPLIYTHFLPKYKDGVICAQILIFGAFFVGMIRNGANYLIAVDMQTRLLKYVIISVAANAGGSILLARLGFGINGIAVAASVASALLASLVWRRVFVELGYAWKNRMMLYASFYLPFFGTLLTIVVMRLAFSHFGGGSEHWLPLQMSLVLCVCVSVILAVPSTRAQLKDLYDRALSGFVYRFKPPLAK
jgi:O-antigen/teichoic acid export membrane protein